MVKLAESARTSGIVKCISGVDKKQSEDTSAEQEEMPKRKWVKCERENEKWESKSERVDFQ